jgi:hypothetical protein
MQKEKPALQESGRVLHSLTSITLKSMHLVLGILLIQLNERQHDIDACIPTNIFYFSLPLTH